MREELGYKTSEGMQAGTPKGNSVPIEQPEFERLYQNMSANISDIDYLASEIINSLGKFLPLKQEDLKGEEKEPHGLVDTFGQRINYMRRIIGRLDEANSILRKLV